MKSPLRLLGLALLPLLGLHPTLRAANDDETTARKVALEVAGAFSNDGFKIRDGNWSGQCELGKSRIIQVNLYAGNQYWFTVGATESAKKIAVTLFDELGQSLPTLPYQSPTTVAAGFAATTSGPYYIKIELTEGTTATFSLIYSYR
jgi:hypothetical protein